MKSFPKFENNPHYLRVYNCAVMYRNVYQDYGQQAAAKYLDGFSSEMVSKIKATLLLFKHKGEQETRKELEAADGES